MKPLSSSHSRTHDLLDFIHDVLGRLWMPLAARMLARLMTITGPLLRKDAAATE